MQQNVHKIKKHKITVKTYLATKELNTFHVQKQGSVLDGDFNFTVQIKAATKSAFWQKNIPAF